MAFKDTKTSDYVVGQRWVRRGPLRILLAQVRGRWAFTATLPEVRAFAARHVQARLVADQANGTAIRDVLPWGIDGLIPVNRNAGKKVHDRAGTQAIAAPHALQSGREQYRARMRRELWATV